MSQEVSKWIVGRGPPCAKSGLFKSQLVSQVWEPPKNEGLGPDAWTPPGTWNNKFVLVVRWNYHVSNGCQVKQPIFYVMIWIIQLSCLVYHRHACFRCHLSFSGEKCSFFAFIFYTFVERSLLMIITQKCSCKSHVCNHNWCDSPWTAKLNDAKLENRYGRYATWLYPPMPLMKPREGGTGGVIKLRLGLLSYHVPHQIITAKQVEVYIIM